MAVRTWVGRFAIVDGQPQEESALMRSFPRQRPDEEEDELYVLAEPATPASREYCGQLVDAIGRLYKQDALSMTGAVSRAMKSAHQQLRDWNQRTLREHHVLAGVSCLAVRGRNAYLAQIGPSVAYHVGDGRVRRVIPQDGAVQPLGQADTAEPIFSHYQLSPGDLLVIASPQIDALLGEDTLRSVLLRGGDEALVELFRLAREQRDFSLVLLACVVEPEDEPAAEAQPAPSRAEPLPPAPPPVAVAKAPATGATLPVAAAQPPVRLKGAEAGVRYRRSTGLTGSFPSVPAAAIVALLVLIAVGLLAWVIIPPALKQSRTERFDSLVEDARVAYDSSQATQDPALKREALRTADQKLIDAEALKPGTPEVADLRAKVDAELAKQNAIVELPELERVFDFSEQLPGPVSPKDLAIGGGGAYVLDRQQGRVIAISLLGPNPEPFVMFQTNQQIGQELAGAPQQIAWAEQLGVLLVLDDARRLIAVTPPGQDARILTVRDAQSWGSADGIAHANGNLYVLDRAGDQVWRYPPSQDGFDSEREQLLANLDLEQVIELAVGDALYLVLGDNSILRFRDGAAQPFTQAGIDRALASPGAVVPLASTGTVLVADRGNSRLVVFSQDGTFRQQLVSASFTDLRSIAMDETNRLIYIMVAGILYRTPLPAAPQ